MDIATVDDDQAFVTEFAQVSGQGFRGHADAGSDDFFAGLQRDGGLPGQPGLLSGLFEQVIEQALGASEAIVIAGSIEFGGALALRQCSDDTAAQVAVLMHRLTQRSCIDSDQQGRGGAGAPGDVMLGAKHFTGTDQLLFLYQLDDAPGTSRHGHSALDAAAKQDEGLANRLPGFVKYSSGGQFDQPACCNQVFDKRRGQSAKQLAAG